MLTETIWAKMKSAAENKRTTHRTIHASSVHNNLKGTVHYNLCDSPALIQKRDATTEQDRVLFTQLACILGHGSWKEPEALDTVRGMQSAHPWWVQR